MSEELVAVDGDGVLNLNIRSGPRPIVMSVLGAGGRVELSLTREQALHFSEGLRMLVRKSLAMKEAAS